MCWQLYYLKIIKNEKRLEFERQFEDGELDLIHECNQILGNFNSFSDYYSMLKSSLQELKEYIEFIEKEVEVPIKVISVGPDRKQTIMK